MTGRTPPKETADLVLELQDPTGFEEREADRVVERARARAVLRYVPPPSAGVRGVTGERFDFVAPLSPLECDEIDWYLERYHRWPSDVSKERAQRIEVHLEIWGRQIYEAIAEARETRAPFESWLRAPSKAVRRLTVLVDESGGGDASAGATLLLGIPWELAHDGRGYLFQGGRPVRVRRRLHLREVFDVPRQDLPLRVLIVSPRPEQDGICFFDHRVSSSPLVEALNALGDNAELALLQPPTAKGLAQELREAQESGRPYHVLHFDGHGVYNQRQSTGQLYFEEPSDEHKWEGRRAALVDANEIGAVLRHHGISLVFLEACQSGKSAEDPTSSVASRLLQAGVGSVVAMSHAVQVETTRRFVQEFYSQLVRARAVGDAFTAGQVELHGDDLRGYIFGGEFRLKDWFVPILFQGEDDPPMVAGGGVPFRDFDWRSRMGQAPDEPEWRFIGRSRELLAAERHLLGRSRGGATPRYLVFRGEGGEGKTTLAAELARWLVKTRRVDQAAFVSMEQVVDEQSLLWALEEQLVDGFVSAARQNEDDGATLLKEALAERRTLLIFDNMETALDSEDLTDRVLGVARDLRDVGETRLVFTTRTPLPGPFSLHALDVSRLSRSDAVVLVTRILHQEGAVTRIADEAEGEHEIVRLVETARGHARSLVLLAQEAAASGIWRATENLQEVFDELEER